MAKLEAINENIVAALVAPAKGNELHYATGLSLQGKRCPAGFAVRVTAAGAKSFVLFHRVNGKPYLPTIGRWTGQGGALSVRDAIIAADKLAKDLKNGRREDPRPDRTRRLEEANQPSEKNIAGLLDNFVARYVKKNLRSAGMIEQTLDRL